MKNLFKSASCGNPAKFIFLKDENNSWSPYKNMIHNMEDTHSIFQKTVGISAKEQLEGFLTQLQKADNESFSEVADRALTKIELMLGSIENALDRHLKENEGVDFFSKEIVDKVEKSLEEAGNSHSEKNIKIETLKENIYGVSIQSEVFKSVIEYWKKKLQNMQKKENYFGEKFKKNDFMNFIREFEKFISSEEEMLTQIANSSENWYKSPTYLQQAEKR